MAAPRTPTWRYIFATRYLVERRWVSGAYRKLSMQHSPSGGVRRPRGFYMMNLAVEAWGEALDAS
jgi:hypothetical protein